MPPRRSKVTCFSNTAGHIRADTLGVEDAGGQSEQRVNVALLE